MVVVVVTKSDAATSKSSWTTTWADDVGDVDDYDDYMLEIRTTTVLVMVQ